MFADAVVGLNEDLNRWSSLAILHLCACKKVAASLDCGVLYLENDLVPTWFCCFIHRLVLLHLVFQVEKIILLVFFEIICLIRLNYSLHHIFG